MSVAVVYVIYLRIFIILTNPEPEAYSEPCQIHTIVRVLQNSV